MVCALVASACEHSRARMPTKLLTLDGGDHYARRSVVGDATYLLSTPANDGALTWTVENRAVSRRMRQRRDEGPTSHLWRVPSSQRTNCLSLVRHIITASGLATAAAFFWSSQTCATHRCFGPVRRGVTSRTDLRTAFPRPAQTRIRCVVSPSSRVPFGRLCAWCPVPLVEGTERGGPARGCQPVRPKLRDKRSTNFP